MKKIFMKKNIYEKKIMKKKIHEKKNSWKKNHEKKNSWTFCESFKKIQLKLREQ